MSRALLLVLLLAPSIAGAHGEPPAAVLVTEVAPRLHLVRHAGVGLETACPQARLVDGLGLLACRLEGTTLRISGLREGGSALVRVQRLGAPAHLAVATPGAPAITLPVTPAWTTTARDYLTLGAHHLVTGWDHLLFLLGLLCAVRSLRGAFLALSAFTVGHSVTLSAAVLGWLVVPPALAELAIAASLILLALDLAQGHAPRRPARLAAALGLVHGLGFAGALVDAGLPAGDVPLALASFNLGIELAQLALALAVLLVVRVARVEPATQGRWVGHVIGAAGAMWCLERAAGLF